MKRFLIKMECEESIERWIRSFKKRERKKEEFRIVEMM